MDSQLDSQIDLELEFELEQFKQQKLEKEKIEKEKEKENLELENYIKEKLEKEKIEKEKEELELENYVKEKEKIYSFKVDWRCTGRSLFMESFASGYNLTIEDSIEILENESKGDPNLRIQILNFPDYEGWTPLMLACHHRDYDSIKYLLSQPGIEINTKVKSRVDCQTPLQLICYHGSDKSLKLFLQNPNLELFTKNGDNQTALDIAILYKWRIITKILKKLINPAFIYVLIDNYQFGVREINHEAFDFNKKKEKSLNILRFLKIMKSLPKEIVMFISNLMYDSNKSVIPYNVINQVIKQLEN
jgi:hypothetical protein